MRITWTLEMLQKEALKYKTRSEFSKNSLGAYKSALRYKILDEICSHMTWKHKKWTIEKLHEEALKYKTISEFQKKSSSAWQTIKNRGLFDKLCRHIAYVNHRWTDEELREEALKYKTRSEFQRKSNSAYQIAYDRNLLELCSHIPKHVDQSGENNPRFRWTIEMLQKEAYKYSTRSEFQDKNHAAYGAALRRGLIDKICSHMKRSICISSYEKTLLDTIKDVYPKAQTFRDRKVNIQGREYAKGFQIDIYVPELRKGIEFDGTYWHSIGGLKRSRKEWPEEALENYHRIKDEYFKSKGIDILHIKEEEWLDDRQSCIDRCFQFLGK